MADKKANQGTLLNPEDVTANDIVRTSKLDGTGGNGMYMTVQSLKKPITILQSDAGTMLAGVPAYPVDGQVYLLTSLGITGVDHIRTVGIVDANTADFVFNNNCEAYLDGLGVYVPCTYDVATNKIYCKVQDDGIISQVGTSSPTLAILNKNIIGVTYAPNYTDVGLYAIAPSTALSSIFTKVITTSQGTAISSSDIINPLSHVFSYYNYGLDEVRLATQSVDGTLTDGILDETPISIIGFIYN